MIKTTITSFSEEKIVNVWASQFMSMFVKYLYKGAVDNLFTFISSINFKSESIPIGLRILQYQRSLYLLGVTQSNEKAVHGRNILNALYQYQNVDNPQVEAENIMIDQMENILLNLRQNTLNTGYYYGEYRDSRTIIKEEDRSPNKCRKKPNLNKTASICGNLHIYIYIYLYIYI